MAKPVITTTAAIKGLQHVSPENHLLIGDGAMDKAEARALLAAELGRFRAMAYGELVRLIGAVQVVEVAGPSGTGYPVEVDVLRDDRRGGNLRVIGSIDDGGFRAALTPLGDDFVLTPEGKFFGE